MAASKKKRSYTKAPRQPFRRPSCHFCGSFEVKTETGGPASKQFYVWCDECKKRTRCIEVPIEALK